MALCEYPLWIDEPGVIWPAQLFPWAGWVIWQFSYQVKIPGVSETPGLKLVQRQPGGPADICKGRFGQEVSYDTRN
jgi:GH25 family lysozyme M1 (1,4-beta-N-acetylmuramidase)